VPFDEPVRIQQYEIAGRQLLGDNRIAGPVVGAEQQPGRRVELFDPAGAGQQRRQMSRARPDEAAGVRLVRGDHRGSGDAQLPAQLVEVPEQGGRFADPDRQPGDQPEAQMGHAAGRLEAVPGDVADGQ
jgi:hypothetical protein